MMLEADLGARRLGTDLAVLVPHPILDAASLGTVDEFIKPGFSNTSIAKMGLWVTVYVEVAGGFLFL